MTLSSPYCTFVLGTYLVVPFDSLELRSNLAYLDPEPLTQVGQNKANQQKG
jgi:hypothetical protein